MHKRARKAFTMIEVLVTISIISVLAAMTMGGLRSAMISSRASKCSNNLRHLGIATHSYAATFQDAMPAAVIYFQRASSVRTVAWDFESNESQETKPGAVTLFTDQPLDALVCPDLNSSSSNGEPLTGYHYNTTFIGHEGFYPEVGADGRVHDGWSRVRFGLNSSQQRRTDSVALFADGGYRGGANKFMRAPGNTVEFDIGLIHAGTSAFRHRDCCNACYLDGHVGSCADACQSALSTKDVLKFVTNFPSNGFLSADDSAYDPR